MQAPHCLHLDYHFRGACIRPFFHLPVYVPALRGNHSACA